MRKLKPTIAAVLGALLVIVPIVVAYADPLPVPNPLFPDRPEEVPEDAPWPDVPQPPAVNYPNPDLVLATLQGQVEGIAAALQTTPEELLATVMETEAPGAETITMTVEDFLARIAGTPIPDETSAGVAGLPEIAIGNISHAYDLNRLLPAKTDWVRKCVAGANKCTSSSQIAPSPNLADPSLNQFRYSMRVSEWLPSAPAQSVLGTSILLPLAYGLSPVAVPQEVKDAFAENVKTNFIAANMPGGKLVNISGGNWETTTATGTVFNGRHNGGTSWLGGSNIDTGERPTAEGDPYPIWLPLLTSSGGLSANTLPDNAIDFLGFGRIATPSVFSPATSCSNTGGTPNQTRTNNNGTPTITTDDFDEVLWGAQVCRVRQSMSGFGIAIYGNSPVSFEHDLAPLWDAPPTAVSAVTGAISAVVNLLLPSVPTTGSMTAYALSLAGATPDAPGAPSCESLPVPVPVCSELPEAPEAEVPETPDTGELPVGVPDPGDLPVGIPDPGELPVGVPDPGELPVGVPATGGLPLPDLSGVLGTLPTAPALAVTDELLASLGLA